MTRTHTRKGASRMGVVYLDGFEAEKAAMAGQGRLSCQEPSSN